jgi:hypothetical protein
LQGTTSFTIIPALSPRITSRKNNTDLLSSGGVNMHMPMTGQSVSSLILLSVIEEDEECKTQWTMGELMSMVVQEVKEEAVTRLDLSPSSVYAMCSHIHHNPAA